jgi:outer membrane protein W
MKKLLICLALCSVMAVKSQEKQPTQDHKFQIGLRYNPDQEADPLGRRTAGDIGLGVRYKMFGWGLTKFNAGVNVYRIASMNNAKPSLLLNPNVTAEFSLLSSKLRPYISGGYAYKKVEFQDIPNGNGTYSTANYTFNGGSINIGARYYFKHIFAEAGIESFMFKGYRPHLELEYGMVGVGFHF